MKKIFAALVAVALVGASAQTAFAGHGHCGSSGWNTAAAVIGGVTAGVVIGQALAPRPVYYTTPAPVYYPAAGYGYVPAPVVYAAPPVVYAPPPVVVYPRPVYMAPRVVSVGYRYGGHRHGCW